jgi:hypothetical protein
VPTIRHGSVWELDLFQDENEPSLLNAGGANNEVRMLDRNTGAIIRAFGRNAGDFHWAHNLAVDWRGNVFTTEVDTGKRDVSRYVMTDNY